MVALHNIITHRYFKIASGLLLAVTSVQDIIKETSGLKKEHGILLLAFILIFHHATEAVIDIRKAIRNIKKDERWVFSRKLQRFFHSSLYIITASLLIIAGSVYDIVEDIAVMRKEYLELAIGLVFIFMALNKVQEERLRIRAALVEKHGSRKTIDVTKQA